MGRRDELNIEYFEWLYGLVSNGRFARSISYRELLWYLYSTPFFYTIPKDENRAGDGISLRHRFPGVTPSLQVDCSVLEMMIALAIRIEETIMDDTTMGDRMGQWFWGMITNLGLGGMTDDRFDKDYVDEVIWRFHNRKYDRDGKGGLFRVRNSDYDLRKVEIWIQMCWYLDSISDF